jgi:hypothetical protein
MQGRGNGRFGCTYELVRLRFELLPLLVELLLLLLEVLLGELHRLLQMTQRLPHHTKETHTKTTSVRGREDMILFEPL